MRHFVLLTLLILLFSNFNLQSQTPNPLKTANDNNSISQIESMKTLLAEYEDRIKVLEINKGYHSDNIQFYSILITIIITLTAIAIGLWANHLLKFQTDKVEKKLNKFKKEYKDYKSELDDFLTESLVTMGNGSSNVAKGYLKAELYLIYIYQLTEALISYLKFIERIKDEKDQKNEEYTPEYIEYWIDYIRNEYKTINDEYIKYKPKIIGSLSIYEHVNFDRNLNSILKINSDLFHEENKKIRIIYDEIINIKNTQVTDIVNNNISNTKKNIPNTKKTNKRSLFRKFVDYICNK